MFGASVAFAGERLVVGAPGANKVGTNRRAPGVGTVTVFAWSAISEVWKERGTAQPFVHEAGMFGAAVEAVGDELWVAAPMADRGTGQLYRVGLDRDGRVTAVSAVAVGDVEPGSRLGTAFAVRGARAVVGLPGDGGGEGTALFLARNARGEWTRDGVVYPASDAKTFAAVTGKERLCEGGTVGEFECGGSSLLSFLPISAIGGGRGTRLNDNWGWTDPVTRREIAIVGRTDGTSFIDVTDPANPRYLGNLPKTKGQPSAAWRDIKVYKDHAFIVADASGEHGMQVFDLTRLRAVKAPQTFEPDVTYDRINSAHNIVSNEQTGFMYIVGGSGGGETCGGGYHMVDVREPKRPKFVGCFGDPKTGRAGTGYSHDAQCVVYHGPDARYTGKEICIGSNETAISIADLSDKANPVAISRASYPNVAYAHQAWLTDDHRYLYLNDEGDESAGKGEAAKGTRTLVWDLADLTDPVLVKEHVGVKKAIDHNLYVKGNRMYQANYTSGLRILDITDPRNPSEVGYFDTHPGDEDKPEFAGAWSVYPYFRSGTIVVTSIGEGVFFVKDRSQQPVVP
jgi:choice-of-anchor B domain-containing protein